MSSPAEQVSAFKGIVDRAIRQGTPGSRDHYPGKGQQLRLGDLLFISAAPRTGADVVLGLTDQHRWGIIQSNQRSEKRVGRLAVVAVESKDESLIRRWSFSSPCNGMPVLTERSLTTPDDIDLAVEWAMSPHLNRNNLVALGTMDDTELASYDRQMTICLEAASEIERGNEDILRARRLSASSVLQSSGLI